MQIKIRRAEHSDATALRDLYDMPLAQAGTLHLPYQDLSNWQKWLDDSSLIRLVALIDGLVVGDMVLRVETNPRRKHVASIGIGVRDDRAGCGVGSALLTAMIDLADNWLNLHRLELTVYADNEGAIALYRKFGFEQEGRSPDYAFRSGAYVDVLHMGRVRTP
ncbi:GNAT family N-acetyltransferase [Serratia marcescens]|uniref:GNAT family N-acetyltransferase n=1 Tax=Serratia marcescens TaxID=615 RepID=UPI002767B5BE|nr:GNAT family N-acetyltransferase [Serratia marcescens]MDP8611820.1 GNAT family N-acetyltransferase [Serratia marcescens]MDP8681410.1 GNAT family N-acetyltransferase [Serratia marcescens]